MKRFFCMIIILFFFISTAESFWSAPKEFADIENPILVNDQSLQKGKAIYFKNCVKCHGKEGKGDGVTAGSLRIKLPNFSRGLDLDSDGELFYKVATGRFEMAPFQLILSNNEIWQSIIFVRSLAKE